MRLNSHNNIDHNSKRSSTTFAMKQNFQVGGMLIVFFSMLSLEAINSRPKNVINSGEKEGSNWDPPLRKGIANQDSLMYLYDSI